MAICCNHQGKPISILYPLPLIVYWVYFLNGDVMVVIGFYDAIPATLKG